MNLQKKSNVDTAKQVLLVILDGVGYTEKGVEFGNAVAKADMPVLKSLWAKEPTIQIKAHGTAVGMPSDDDMGNSEVGHNVLGCGRVFSQGAKLVNQSLASKDMFHAETWKALVENCKIKRSTLHFIGLLSDGNVHSHISHLKQMIEQAKKEGVGTVRIHALLDGRDVPEKSALEYTEPFEEFLTSLRDENFDAKIASGGGRMTITMDRYEADWQMVKRGWDIHVRGEGRQYGSIKEAIEALRKEDPKVIDQYLPGFVISENDKPLGKIVDGDSVIFFNFRGDRAIELSMAFSYEDFDKFDRGKKPDVVYAGMMQYDGDLKLPEKFLVSPPAIDRTISEYLAKAGIKQYAISETQKYGHVTYFWNGNRSGYFDKNLEAYKEIPSDIIPFDQAPKMKAAEITEELIKAVESQEYPFLRVNYANGDMVGHTGNFDATVASMEFLDTCLVKLMESAKKTETVVLITADHGNSDEMYQLDKKGNAMYDSKGNPVPKTSHTLNPVNLMLFDPVKRWNLKKDKEAGLGNIAATILELLGYEAPEGYLPSLLEKA
ncbi:MAG: 2,3-bisphosphoglycerate-independent phosphoglycerate mutase [Leptospiraceae bacterium]|nr:2,3-bisphosphoglycerate-independent phosphoglycerate mutase [Leptospiraceae bacterium]MCP5499116.1 2,3-bisphosphoglycerate-independent phosphoglycerate mutase [Leptospiraceae bacterium]